jgi:hypothetical protein
MRGKRRLHKRPSSYEIERCKVSLELERTIIKPAWRWVSPPREVRSAEQSPSSRCAAAP